MIAWMTKVRSLKMKLRNRLETTLIPSFELELGRMAQCTSPVLR